MKRFTIMITAVMSLIFLACEGPAGPPGPPGFDGFDGADGADGVNILGQVIEIEGSFTPQNDYTIFYEFPQTVEVFESDVVLVYILWEQTEDGNGEAVDIWRLLPQTRILNEGLLQYNYDHTFFDVSMFLESDFDLSLLPPGDTQNQVFRIAILPADYVQSNNIDTANLDAVMKQLQFPESQVEKHIMN
ncbi:collagen-like protein [Zeaxanthinibacter sp. PT1]|uniref:collagen-like protein n=1 Tax=Zeaxanthinibacter TaxID=561554 RepID=UPI00234A8B6B|nr:collagen-like protein [Zeaxanthinibacter sp. PT1]MDC6352024.1 collagen-like protein [Zeaxanthinibacter sp. PT1]